MSANHGEDICKRFGANVRRMRRAQDISQEELAHRADVHRTYLSSLERTGGRNPTLRVMERIAVALGVDVADLLEAQGGGAASLKPSTDK